MLAPYVLVTPARNEEDYLGRTIESVVRQTHRPRRYVLVSDGSTDRTEEIAAEQADRHDFVHLVTARAGGARNFGSKVAAIRAGLRELEGIDYELLGFLDADVSFERTYFERLVARMVARPTLGIAGGVVTEWTGTAFVPQLNSKTSVAGAVQTFRRRCWEEIGGYLALPRGGIDAAAEIVARARGWEVETFEDLQVRHHRRVSHGRGNIVRERFRQGRNQYTLGYHPIFEAARCVWRLRERPLLVGSAAMMAGYVWAGLRRDRKVLPGDAIEHLRAEQLKRLGELLTR